MKDKFENNNKYAWNDSMILDKIQEILEGKNIDDLEFTKEELENIKSHLLENVTCKDLHESAYLIADNIDELKVLPNDEIKDYILRLKNYLATSTIKYIKAEFKGIEFDVYADSSVDDIFNDYYTKYDETYGISEMLSDLGLK
ncbi:MAG: hypothetical protein ACRCXA_11430 [Peptostreptococcaceae bacterium]